MKMSNTIINNELCIKINSRIDTIPHILDVDIDANCQLYIKCILSNNKIITFGKKRRKLEGLYYLFLTKGVNYIIIYPSLCDQSIMTINKIFIKLGNRNILVNCIVSLEKRIFKSIPLKKESEHDFYNNNELNNSMLDTIYENIDMFTVKIKDYKNILFLCTDYPNFGGAATNCNDIQNFYSSDHKTYSIFYTENCKQEKNQKHCITNYDNFVNELKSMEFTPDLIILKNFLPTGVNIKDHFDCPVWFCIPGIFSESLNRYYTAFTTNSEYNIYIEQKILDQIKKSDMNFCNSYHTKKILLKYYGIETELFYSNFVKFYKKKIEHDDNFNNRKYDYGLVMSSFDRKIKNVSESISSLIGKKNVILIGNKCQKYLHYGFTCIELENNNEVMKKLKEIKYIIQDSFYESCSNVKIEAIFSGCILMDSKNIDKIDLKTNI